MKKSNIAVTLGGLLTQAGTAAGGLHLLEALLLINNNKEADVRADHDQAKKMSLEYQAATTATPLAIAARDAADDKATAFITVTRELLKPKLGSRYSLAWNAVGFYSRTLQVPTQLDLRVNLVDSIAGYLEAHPELEVEGTMTATLADDVLQDLNNAIQAAGVAKSAQRIAKGRRDSAATVLRKRMQNLYHELKQFLPDNDPRWLEFGFNVPADMSVPDAPSVLTAVPGAAGHVFTSWEMPPGATRVRLFQQVVGVDAEFVHVDTLKESSKYLGGFPSGAHVKFYITAANPAGESLPSQTVEVVVP